MERIIREMEEQLKGREKELREKNEYFEEKLKKLSRNHSMEITAIQTFI